MAFYKFAKDMKYVEQVVGALEENGISCFVAMRNLRHGKGAVENYDLALEQAMNNSKIFLLVSSCNSRSLACDALKKELPYLKSKDLEYAPAELRHDYNKLPVKYKKPRVQLLIDGKPKGTLADKMVSEIFNGFEWRYDVDSTVEAIFHILTSGIKQENEIDRVKKELEEKQLKQQEELKKMMEDLLEKQTAKTNTEVKIQGALGVEEKQLKQEENKKFEKNLAPEQSVNIGQNNVVTNSDTASSNYLDFEINNGVLVKYKGSDRTVIIPNNVIAIGGSAFKRCASITTVTIPDGVTSIALSAFERCKSLKTITIPNSMKKISYSAFEGCDSLKEVCIFDIKSWCSIEFQDNPLKFAHNLYLNNKLVTNLIIPNNVTSISQNAFSGCKSLKSVTIPDSVTSIGISAFNGCSFTSFRIPKNVEFISGFAFSTCFDLRDIIIPKSVKAIGVWAFYGCYGLKVHYEGSKEDWKNIKIDGYLFGGNKPLRKARKEFNYKG